MNRRGFLGVVSMALSAAAVPSAELVPNRRERLRYASCPPIARAHGKAFILGVATETVHAGDLVQIQVYGPATVTVLVKDDN